MTTSYDIGLADSTFFKHSMSCGCDTESTTSPRIKWRREVGYGEYDIYVWTDIRLREVLLDSLSRKRIGVLIEPRCLTDTHLKAALELRNEFDCIYTHDKILLDTGEPFRFYPFGGSWVDEWGVYHKSKMVSMIVGQKSKTIGHKMRHDIAGLAKDRVDLFGEPFTGYFTSKKVALKKYRYSIVVENCRHDYWFTEKLIDCISQGTVPVYWGCPSIEKFFDTDGLIQFSNIDQLLKILGELSVDDYNSRLESVTKNIEIARRYAVAEDYIIDDMASIGMIDDNFYGFDFGVKNACQIPDIQEIYRSVFGNKVQGQFAEIGSYDGESWSNVAPLADMGWRGVMCEPNPDMYYKCSARHISNDVIVRMWAVGESNRDARLYITPGKEAIATTKLDWVEGDSRLSPNHFVDVKMVTLDDVLSLLPGEYDIVVIDTEGNEPDILDNFNIDRWRPKMFIVECHEHLGHPIRSANAPRINEYFTRNGYKKIYSDSTNNIYIRGDQ